MTLAHFWKSGNSAVFDRKQGIFQVLEAKDVTFEAKAKDFKMSSRGLHL